MLKLTCALGLVLDNLRLFKEPLLRQLAYEHGQRHVVHAMRPQYVFHIFMLHLCFIQWFIQIPSSVPAVDGYLAFSSPPVRQ
jgi:hypothetical protein